MQTVYRYDNKHLSIRAIHSQCGTVTTCYNKCCIYICNALFQMLCNLFM